jgi:hypothetical protein
MQDMQNPPRWEPSRAAGGTAAGLLFTADLRSQTDLRRFTHSSSPAVRWQVLEPPESAGRRKTCVRKRGARQGPASKREEI